MEVIRVIAKYGESPIGSVHEYPFIGLKLGGIYLFRLSPESLVRLINPPFPEFKNLTGRWGDFREKLEISEHEQRRRGTSNLNFQVELLEVEAKDKSGLIVVPEWICYDPQHIIALAKELNDQVRRRNCQIKDFRKENQKLRKKLAVLSAIK